MTRKPRPLLSTHLILPAAYHTRQRGYQELALEDTAALKQYLQHEVNVERLNEIHNHLWLADLPQPGRPLFNQLVLGRSIVSTGDADLHLTWHDSRIFLKYLPDFHLCQSIWETYLSKDRDSYEAASGLLLSCSWLFCMKLDLKIAQDHLLLPETTIGLSP